jgi:transposase
LALAIGSGRDAGRECPAPKRERLTVIRIFEELRNRGYGGGYDAVRRYAAGWSKVAQEASASAYVPLSFDPGEAYQFDWSHEIVMIDGVTVTVKVAHVRLCHSRMPFVRAYPRETQEMVFDAHDKAFAFFGGACARGIYDNMKTAVDTIFVGKDRAYNRRFQQMCGHYLVDPVACTPGSGWEKGQVENQVGVLRRRFFVPRPKFKSYAELNAWLARPLCIAWAKANRIPTFRTRRSGRCSKRSGRAWCPMSVRSTASTPCRPRSPRPASCASTRTATRSMPAAVGPAGRDPCLCRPRIEPSGRTAGRGASMPAPSAAARTIYDPLHYIPVLARKPGACATAPPSRTGTCRRPCGAFSAS